MISSLAHIINWLVLYKYAVLFPVSVIEGPIIGVISGFLVSKGVLSLPIVFVVLMLGDWVGDTLYYSIGRFGGRPFIRHFGKYFRMDEKKLLAGEEYFKRHGGKTLLIGKTQAMGGIILAAAGAMKMPYVRFMLYNIIGSLPKCVIFIIIGYYFGAAYDLINQYLGFAAAVSIIPLAAFILIYLFFRKRKNEKNSNSN